MAASNGGVLHALAKQIGHWECAGLRVAGGPSELSGLGFRVQGLVLRVQGSRLKVQGLGVLGVLGFMV